RRRPCGARRRKYCPHSGEFGGPGLGSNRAFPRTGRMPASRGSTSLSVDEEHVSDLNRVSLQEPGRMDAQPVQVDTVRTLQVHEAHIRSGAPQGRVSARHQLALDADFDLARAPNHDLFGKEIEL